MKKILSLTTLLISILLISGCSLVEFKDADLDVPTISVSSSSIVDEKFSSTIAADKKSNDPIGENHSPALSWEAVKDANYYAVIMFDETANWLHLFVTDIIDTQLSEGTYTNTNT